MTEDLIDRVGRGLDHPRLMLSICDAILAERLHDPIPPELRNDIAVITATISIAAVAAERKRVLRRRTQ